MDLRPTRMVVAAAVAVAAVLTAACGSPENPAASGGSTLSVVASTNVYGDIVGRIAGDRAQVTSIISDPGQDPHSYEADARTRLALSRARVVVENGGGYDDFVDSMLHASKSSATVLNVVAVSGRQPPGGGSLNEHVWYDLPTVRTLAARLVGALSAADPGSAATFRANATGFTARLADLERTEAQLKKAHGGAGVAITEPVPLYLLDACGLVNRTPADFSKAIEEGTDVSPRALQQTLDLFTGKRVSLLAYNEQTSGPQTQRVLSAARAAGIPVVPVTETLPAGRDYLGWMADNLTAVRRALS